MEILKYVLYTTNIEMHRDNQNTKIMAYSISIFVRYVCVWVCGKRVITSRSNVSTFQLIGFCSSTVLCFCSLPPPRLSEALSLSSSPQPPLLKTFEKIFNFNGYHLWPTHVLGPCMCIFACMSWWYRYIWRLTDFLINSASKTSFQSVQNDRLQCANQK